MEPSIESLLSNIIKGFGLKETALILVPIFYLLTYLLNIQYKKVNSKFYNIDERYFEYYDIKKLLYIFAAVLAYVILIIKISSSCINDADISMIFPLILNFITFYLLGNLLNRRIYAKTTAIKGSNYYNSDNIKKYNCSFVISFCVISLLFLIKIKPLFVVKLTYLILFIFVIFSIIKYKNWEIKVEKLNVLNTIVNFIKKWNYSTAIGYCAIYFGIITWIAMNAISSYSIADNIKPETSFKINNNSSSKKIDDTLSLKFSRITAEINKDIQTCNDWTIYDLCKNFFYTDSLVSKAAKKIDKEQSASVKKNDKEQSASVKNIEDEYKNYINPDPNKYIMLKLHPNGGTIEGDFVYWLRKGHLLTEKDLSNTRAIKNVLPLKYWGLNKNSFNSALPLYVNYFKGNVNLYANYEDARGVISGSETKDLANKYIQLLEANNYKGEFFKLLRVLIILEYNNNLGLIYQFLISFVILLAITFIAINELLFNPSNKKIYDYIQLDGDEKYYIITEYKGDFLCMKGKLADTSNLNLEVESFKLVSPNDKYEIKSIEYKRVSAGFKEDSYLEKLVLRLLVIMSLIVVFLVFID